MDAFSEILSGVKLNGALFFNADFSAPWGFATPASKALAPSLAPGALHLVIYHLVIEGRAVARLGDGEWLSLGPGDVVIFPHGDPHLVTSGADDPWRSSDQLDTIVERWSGAAVPVTAAVEWDLLEVGAP